MKDSRNFPLLTLGAMALLVAACATPPAAPALGQSKATAIEVCGPPGQRAYLNQLVCPSGERPTYQRVGSVGPRTALPRARSEEEAAVRFKRAFSSRALQPGEPDEHVVDRYEVTCGGVKHVVYMDMYHCDQPAPTIAPPGLQFRPLDRRILSI